MPFIAPALPAIIGAGGSLGASAIAASGQKKAAKTAKQIAEEELALRKKILDQIMPFAQQLIGLGLDPQKILSSPLGAALLAPGREAVGKEFEQQRMNLVDLLAGSGFSTGSGLAAGPLANLFGQEASAQASLMQQLPLQALQLGQQGASILQGIPTNPVGAFSNLANLQAQPNFFAQALANLPAAIGGILTNLRSNPQTVAGIPGVIPITPGRGGNVFLSG